MKDTLEIIKKMRPLFELTDTELNNLELNAIMMAETATNGPDPESMSSRIIRITAWRMLCEFEEEIANRN